MKGATTAKFGVKHSLEFSFFLFTLIYVIWSTEGFEGNARACGKGNPPLLVSSATKHYKT